MHEDKLAAQKQWNTNPCGTGTHVADLEYASLDFFESVRRHRYEETDPWMKEVFDFSVARGKRLLEIGHGMGTDLLSFAEGGAEVYGIDLTQEHHDLATRNFELHGRTAELKLCDAAEITYPSAFFDVVYSNGVLHHTPDTVRAISEAYRVLKPGGQLLMSVYHTYSAFHFFSKILYDGLYKGKLKKLGYQGLLSTVEYGADGLDIKPLVKTYGKAQLRHMLADFSHVTFKVAHFQRVQIPVFGRFLPQALLKTIDRHWGWYLVAFATK